MANIEINTTELKENGKDIMKLTIELNEVLESLYNRFDRMPLYTREWTGMASEEFVKKLNKEKKEYFALKDNIYNYGKLLCNIAERMELFIGDIKNE